MQCCTFFQLSMMERRGLPQSAGARHRMRGPDTAELSKKELVSIKLFNVLIPKFGRYQAVLSTLLKWSMIQHWGPTQSAGAQRRAPGPTQSAAARHKAPGPDRERRHRVQSAGADTERPGPTQSAGARHRAPRPDRERRHRGPGPDTERWGPARPK